MKALILRHDDAGHRFEHHTARLLHHLIHFGPCLLRTHRGGRLEEIPIHFGLFILHGEKLQDPESGLSIHPARLPLAYLLPGTDKENPLLCLADAAGAPVLDIVLPASAWNSPMLRDLVERLQPAPVDAEKIRSHCTTGSWVQAA